MIDEKYIQAHKSRVDFVQEALYRLAEVISTHSSEGARLYAVGGYPRNKILGFEPSDIDVTSKLHPEELIRICDRVGFYYVPKGIEFGTVEVHIPLDERELVVEHTTFRSDSYAPGGAHKPQEIRFSDSIREDALRRDFTVNAIYEDILTGETVDPTGGILDIERRIIRTTSDDPAVVLKDDGLRIMRMVRFACELGFSIDADTFAAAHKHVSGLQAISRERIRDELVKILMADIKYGAVCEISPVLRGLLMLQAMDIFAIILPELEGGRNFAQKRKYHRYDVQTHMLHTAAATPPKLHMRLAGLLHDVGKPEAHTINEGKNMHGHDKLGVPIAARALKRLRFSRELTERVLKLISIHMYDVARNARENNIRTHFAQWGHELVLDLIDFRRADLKGSGVYNPVKNDSAQRFEEVYNAMVSEGAPFSYFDLKITGGDIMRELNLPPCPLVGDIKRKLLRHCAISPKDNEINTLLKLARELSGQ